MLNLIVNGIPLTVPINSTIILPPIQTNMPSNVPDNKSVHCLNSPSKSASPNTSSKTPALPHFRQTPPSLGSPSKGYISNSQDILGSLILQTGISNSTIIKTPVKKLSSSNYDLVMSAAEADTAPNMSLNEPGIDSSAFGNDREHESLIHNGLSSSKLAVQEQISVSEVDTTDYNVFRDDTDDSNLPDIIKSLNVTKRVKSPVLGGNFESPRRNVSASGDTTITFYDFDKGRNIQRKLAQDQSFFCSVVSPRKDASLISNRVRSYGDMSPSNYNQPNICFTSTEGLLSPTYAGILPDFLQAPSATFVVSPLKGPDPSVSHLLLTPSKQSPSRSPSYRLSITPGKKPVLALDGFSSMFYPSHSFPETPSKSDDNNSSTIKGNKLNDLDLSKTPVRIHVSFTKENTIQPSSMAITSQSKVLSSVDHRISLQAGNSETVSISEESSSRNPDNSETVGISVGIVGINPGAAEYDEEIDIKPCIEGSEPIKELLTCAEPLQNSSDLESTESNIQCSESPLVISSDIIKCRCSLKKNEECMCISPNSPHPETSPHAIALSFEREPEEVIYITAEESNTSVEGEPEENSSFNQDSSFNNVTEPFNFENRPPDLLQNGSGSPSYEYSADVQPVSHVPSTDTEVLDCEIDSSFVQCKSDQVVLGKHSIDSKQNSEDSVHSHGLPSGCDDFKVQLSLMNSTICNIELALTSVIAESLFEQTGEFLEESVVEDTSVSNDCENGVEDVKPHVYSDDELFSVSPISSIVAEVMVMLSVICASGGDRNASNHGRDGSNQPDQQRQPPFQTIRGTETRRSGMGGSGGKDEDDENRKQKPTYYDAMDSDSSHEDVEEECHDEISLPKDTEVNSTHVQSSLLSPESRRSTLERETGFHTPPKKSSFHSPASCGAKFLEKRKTPIKILSRPASSKCSPLKKLVSPILRKYKRMSPYKTRSTKVQPIQPKIVKRASPKHVLIAPNASPSSRSFKSHDRNDETNFPQQSLGNSVSYLRWRTENEKLQTGAPEEVLMSLEEHLTPSNCDQEAGPSLKRRLGTSSSQSDNKVDVPQTNKNRRIADDEEKSDDSNDQHLEALLKAASTINKRRAANKVGDSPRTSKRLSKEHKQIQAKVNALSSPIDTDARNKLFAGLFLTRVVTRFANEPHSIQQFLEALHLILTDSAPIADVYHQITNQIFKDHPDLGIEFLGFLLPHQAITLGKYQEYCQQQRLLNLLYQLQLLQKKQPSLLQKILRKLAFYHVHFRGLVEHMENQITSPSKDPKDQMLPAEVLSGQRCHEKNATGK